MERVYRTALSVVPGMNPLVLAGLLKLVPRSEELWAVFREGGRRSVALVGSERSARWREFCRGRSPREIYRDVVRGGTKVVLPEDDTYPVGLREIYDPPPILFQRGEPPPPGAPHVALVGARKATSYGKRVAELLGYGVGERGGVVVSGAAYGVDGRAHRGCLQAEGFTLAVLGCGIERAYPPGHRELIGEIAGKGCVLSEFPLHVPPLPWHFPHRNRIIAGLSHVVVVVEAGEKSGALITAELALEEGREVMAVPGPITSPFSEGSNRLILHGAKPVCSVEDIWEELPESLRRRNDAIKGHEAGGSEETNAGQADPLREFIVGCLGEGTMDLDSIAARSGRGTGEILAVLASLQLEGVVTVVEGGRFCLSTASGKINNFSVH